MSDILCPICKKPVPPVAPGEKSFSPFCSDRCKLIDLGRWLDGKYQIEVRGAVDPDDAQRAQDDEDEPPIR